ncbi:DNA polymerase III subunit delta [Burkholderiales bacterium]|nr:DNA polymerase III subunit delta [Burkholderiales bacterium]
MAAVVPLAWHSGARATLAALRARGAHALLLHGPAGVGKWDLATSFARDALCEHAVAPARACGVCASCVLVAAGNHPDLRIVVPDALAQRRPGGAQEDEEPPEAATEAGGAKGKPSREIKIDQVRELASLTGVSTHRGGVRVVVLGPTEALNAPAANALLKGLEEPPPASLFLLVSDQIDRCLPTIVSRCALVRVAVPPRAMALEWLQAQGVGADAGQRLTEAGGAPLAALEPDAQALAPDLRSTLLDLLRRGAALAPADVASDIPRTVPIGASVALFQRWVWDYFSYRLGGGLRYHPGDAASFEALSRHWTLRAASAWIEALHALRAAADHPLNARVAIEGLLLRYIDSIASGRERSEEG